MHESKLEVTKSVSHVKMEEMIPHVSSTLNAYEESSEPDQLEHQHSFFYQSRLCLATRFESDEYVSIEEKQRP